MVSMRFIYYLCFLTSIKFKPPLYQFKNEQKKLCKKYRFPQLLFCFSLNLTDVIHIAVITSNVSQFKTTFFWNDFQDRKSTRLNSSHVRISYAVFCLKKKKKKNNIT